MITYGFRHDGLVAVHHHGFNSDKTIRETFEKIFLDARWVASVSGLMVTFCRLALSSDSLLDRFRIAECVAKGRPSRIGFLCPDSFAIDVGREYQKIFAIHDIPCLVTNDLQELLDWDYMQAKKLLSKKFN